MSIIRFHLETFNFVYLTNGIMKYYFSFVLICRSQYSRTSEDIKSMIKLAKLSEKHLTDVTQVLYCGESINNPDWKLLELNNTLLSAIEEGQVLAFKGMCHN